jgi:DNA-binding beta-propeller fold protein YncE
MQGAGDRPSPVRFIAFTAVLTAVLLAPLIVPSGAGAFGFLRQYATGHPGSGAGELAHPDDVALGPDHDIYVADSDNSRVSVFAPGGRFLRAFGADVGGPGVDICTASCQQGTSGDAAGELAFPEGIDTAADGDVFVADEFANRVSVFTAGGAFVRAFGGDVGGAGIDVCTSACAAGTFGTAAGQLNRPIGLAVGGDGRVYVVEQINDRVSVFTQGGTFLRAFGKGVGGPGVNTCTATCFASTDGTGAGSLSSPFGIDVAGGRVYVADQSNNRVSVFATSGGFLRALGRNVGGPGEDVCTAVCVAGAASGTGSVKFPLAVHAGPGGGIFVGDSGHHRVAEYNLTQGFVSSFGSSGTGPGEFLTPIGFDSDCRQDLYVVDEDVERVQRFGDDPRVPPCPSNSFSFGGLTRDPAAGTARLVIRVPGPGRVKLEGVGVRALNATVPGAGRFLVPIGAAGHKLETLRRTGRASLRARVTYTPKRGDPRTRSKAVTLLKNG